MTNKLRKPLAVILVLAMCMQLMVCIPAFASDEAEIYVALSGEDSATGTADSPYNTVEKAIVAARTLVNSGSYSKVNVIIREGTYSFENGLEFSSLDTGNSSCKIEYKAYPGEEVIFTTSSKVKYSDFSKVEDEEVLARIPEKARGYVIQADFGELGIPYGRMIKNRYMTFTEASSPILYVDSQMQNIARWPNAGWAFQGEIIDSGEGGSGAFLYGEEKDNWKTATEAWYHGFGYHLWADESAPASFDTENKQINLNGELAYGLLEGRPYYIYNLLEELDSPGEWFLDRSTGIMYMYPEADLSESDIRYATSEKPIITIKNASYINFTGITFEGAPGGGISITNGSHHNIIKDCEFRNLGMVGVEIKTDSYENGITGCYMHDLCKTGVNITEQSGDFKTLKHNNNYVENCHIENYGLTSYGYMAAIRAYGIGDRISHNRINGGKHLAIYLNGNDNVIEYNDIYNVMNTAEDMAAIYCWSDWTNLGHKIRYNIIHDMPGTKLPNRTHNAHSIYFDDSASNATIYGNVIANVEAGIYTNGGSYHDIQNNIFINNELFATNIFNWSSQTDDMSIEANRVLMESIANGDEEWAGYQAYTYINHRYRQMYWEQKYPEGKAAYDAKYPWLATFLQSDPFLPTHNTVKKNVSIGLNNATYGDAFRIGNIVVERGDVESNITFEGGLSTDDVHNVTDYSGILSMIPDFEELDITKTGIENETGLKVGDFTVKQPFRMDTKGDEEKIMFHWKNSSGADKYTLTVAKDESFSDIVFEEETNLNYIDVSDLDYTKNKYYWKVTAKSTSHAYSDTTENSEGVQMLDYNQFTLSETDFANVLESFAEEFDSTAAVSYKDFTKEEKEYVVKNIAENKKGLWTEDDVKELFKNAVDKVNNIKVIKNMSEEDIKVAVESDYTKLDISPETYNEYTVLKTAGKEKAISEFTTMLKNTAVPSDLESLFRDAVALGKSEDEKNEEENSSQGSSGSSGAGGGGGSYKPSHKVTIDEKLPEKKDELHEVPVSELTYSDIDNVPWAQEAIRKLTEAGIVNGKGEGIFAPGETVTREEAVKMIVTGFGLSEKGPMAFKDVSEDAWYNEYIAIATACGVVNGISKEEFGVGIPVTRQDMMVMLKRAADYSGMDIYRIQTIRFTDSEDIAKYAEDAVQVMADGGVISGKGNGKFEPLMYASRAETAVMCYRLFAKLVIL